VHRRAHGLVAQESYQVTEGGHQVSSDAEISPGEVAEHADAGHVEFAPPEAWDAIAAGYAEHVAPGEQELSASALRLVGLVPGERFLDVAAGPGTLALTAAHLGATVLAIDWSPQMVTQFERRARANGWTDANGRVMDAHALDLEDDLFDVTGSQFGVMLVPDQASALGEMVRVTKPGGRVLLIAYGSPEEFEALQLFISALQTVAPDFDGLPDPPPLEFQVSDPEVLRERLVAAGLRDVQVDTTQRERLEVSSGQDVWNWMLFSNPITGMILDEVGVGEADRAAMRASIDEWVRERADATGIAVLEAPLNVGWGRKDVTR
jgi:SAM-dependent methyltransferase